MWVSGLVRCVVAATFGFVLALSQTTQAQMYSADLASAEWKLAATPFVCSLTHNIPNFGKAVLNHKAGGVESLYLESQDKVAFPVGVAHIETLPPVWRNDLIPVPLGDTPAIAGNQPIKLAINQISPLLMQLNAGVKVMFSSQQIDSTNTLYPLIMRVVLEAKNFAPAYKTYQQCVADLIPYSFAQMARTLINYGEKPEALTSVHKSELSKVARYVKADPKVLGVFVDGHSDNSATPEANEAISKQEAEWVTAYLVEQGIAADKITTRWHGDQFPIANNKIASGRAQNRRVTVRLEDEAAHKDAQQKEEKRAAEEKAAADKDVTEKTADKTADATASAQSSASGHGKMTPEEINRMVEGLDIIKGQ